MKPSFTVKKLENFLATNRIVARYTVRENGATAGRKDWCYTDTKTKKRYRSMIEVLRALEEEERQTKAVSDTATTSEKMAAEARELKPKNLTWTLYGPDSGDFTWRFNKGTRMKRKGKENKRPCDELPVGFV